MILNGVYDKYMFGYSFEMFWQIELNAGEITKINTIKIQCNSNKIL